MNWKPVSSICEVSMSSKSFLEVNKMAENTKKPAIRFAGFTEAWEQRKLGDVVGIYDGVHQTPKYQDNGIMFLSVENIATLQSSKYISEDDFKRDYKVYPQENDILMTRIGDVGTTNVIADNALKAYYVSLALLKYKSTNPYFLSNAIQSDYVKKGLANRTLKTAIPMKINKDEIGKVDVMLPTSVKEQTKIGEYFRNINNLITLHQREYEKLTSVKKSMLEKMFPKNGSNVPEIRFKGFTEAWEQCKLSELTENIDTGKSKFVSKDSGNYEILGSTSIIGFDDHYDYEGDFLLTARVGVNAGNLYRHAGKVKISDNTVFIQGSHIDFLYYLLEKFDLKRLSFGTGQPLVKASELRALSLTVPSDDQEKEVIGDYFKRLDNLITLHQRKLEKLKNIKKSMLEKMFI
ncbi:restriction endonuclease subunit S [Leptotrichia massiliensis]|uniref:restriction endonuclease subunit S n=1 Tax=Leptotrichia massiliensis TaxID=1852388 RepID=UPI0009F23B70|nr:restriction endonuclease subunit S [Leptotrichia massiliensis]